MEISGRLRREQRIATEISKNREADMQGNKLYVGNLTYAVTKEDLETLFGSHGEVKEVNIIQGKGFGFVEMGSEEQANAAKDALDGSDFKGRTLKVNEARPPKAREGRGFGGQR
jgi:RNA recognition motif-containing protein